MKIPTIASFEEIAQLVAQAISSILPERFKFVLIMVAPDGDVKMLHNTGSKEHAADVVRHVHEGGRKQSFSIIQGGR